ncbi:methyltransferase domain-containing protein [uncultured Legionella sp.]|uniref:methyltransferase domain-containing protein n=1 Tax=uncultured Legionella sp. TaxID=210934 RepID=UPI00260E21DF|nr:methyltransferase domain-containing protein [uncultured Legionella sp.]
MLIEQQIKHYQALNEWFKAPLGSAVADEFTRQLEQVKDYLRGDVLLQLGLCGENQWLDSFDFNHKWLASPFSLNKEPQLECSFNQIPLNRNSVDCVLVPLTLEPFGAGFSLIDEIDRILKPMGLIVLVNINPWSLWGAAMKSGLLHCYNDRHIKMRTAFNLNRIFLQRGYRQCSLNHFCYIPPVNNKSIIKKLSFFDEVGKMIWPFPSGFYCYIAQKYECISPTLITPVVTEPVAKDYKSPLQPAIN